MSVVSMYDKVMSHLHHFIEVYESIDFDSWDFHDVVIATDNVAVFLEYAARLGLIEFMWEREVILEEPDTKARYWVVDVCTLPDYNTILHQYKVYLHSPLGKLLENHNPKED